MEKQVADSTPNGAAKQVSRWWRAALRSDQLVTNIEPEVSRSQQLFLGPTGWLASLPASERVSEQKLLDRA